jgi:hypothetical protein
MLKKSRRGPERKRLLNAVRNILKGRTKPMKFTELFDGVDELGLHVPSKNTRQNFAVFLTKFSCFVNEGRGEGWRYLPERDFDLEDERVPSGPFRDAVGEIFQEKQAGD